MADERPTVGDEIIAEARILERDAAIRERGHRQAAGRWNRVHWGLGVPSVVLAAIAGTSALAEFDKSNVVAGVLALVVAVLTALTTWLNPNRAIDLHLRAANRFHSICARARRLHRLDRFAGRSSDELRLTLYELAAEFDDQISASPLLSDRYLRDAGRPSSESHASPPEAPEPTSEER